MKVVQNGSEDSMIFSAFQALFEKKEEDSKKEDSNFRNREEPMYGFQRGYRF